MYKLKGVNSVNGKIWNIVLVKKTSHVYGLYFLAEELSIDYNVLKSICKKYGAIKPRIGDWQFKNMDSVLKAISEIKNLMNSETKQLL